MKKGITACLIILVLMSTLAGCSQKMGSILPFEPKGSEEDLLHLFADMGDAVFKVDVKGKDLLATFTEIEVKKGEKQESSIAEWRFPKGETLLRVSLREDGSVVLAVSKGTKAEYYADPALPKSAGGGYAVGMGGDIKEGEKMALCAFSGTDGDEVRTFDAQEYLCDASHLEGLYAFKLIYVVFTQAPVETGDNTAVA